MKYYLIMKTPVGELTLFASDTGVASLLWENFDTKKIIKRYNSEMVEHDILLQAKSELKKYFAGNLKNFKIPLDLEGTPFQLKVWQELKKIPYGKTMSYKELATKVGNPNASRAVGGANGKNPVGVIIPCHRVIGASGKLTGFAGGVVVKSKLLKIEKKYITLSNDSRESE
ncbi:methylated-DNA--[protein]-cysteine S-methyltransferase [Bacteriovoracaceae bacterium]|nr:methylated-DNA--[protein]-cysteine S-methyltransferase [Bacteriovoracaceae bacterium]